MPKKRTTSPDRNVSTEWYYGLPPEDREKFKNSLLNSTYVLDQLKKYLEREIAALGPSDVDYESPNWALKRVDKDGQLKTLEKILRFLP